MSSSTALPTGASVVHDDNDYWHDARSPLSSLVFLIPWLVLYEFGVLLMGQEQPDAVRNGADFWMRSLLGRAGLGPVLLPVLVLSVLLVWHLAARKAWRVKPETLAGMFGESILLAIVLVAAGQLHDLMFRLWSPAAADSPELLSVAGPVTRTVSYIGAGVYEEVMFRLLLVPAAWLGFRMFEFPPKSAAVMAAVSTSFLFALAHHVGPAADTFNVFAFSFRAAAGLFFAAVFLLRGFGITVGCHAAYDLLVGVLLAH
jgi:hypothetical protein